jgi:hypothetical protein
MDHSRVCSASSLVGSDLTTSDYADLESRWIDCALAVRACLRRVDSFTGAEIIGRKNGNYVASLFRISTLASSTSASTACAGISPISNTTP